MYLAMLTKGETGTIARLVGSKQIVKRLTDLGFVPGAEITVRNELAGDLMVDVKGTRLALNRSMAMHILLR